MCVRETALSPSGDRLPLVSAGPAGSVGIGPEILAAATSTRHDLDPGIRLWLSTRPGTLGPFSVTCEVSASHRVDDRGDLYRYASWNVAGSVLADWALGTHATAVRLGVGPAGILRSTSFDAGPIQAVGPRFSPGGRARMALDGPLGRATSHLAWSTHTGITVGVEGTDWDVGVGAGYRW